MIIKINNKKLYRNGDDSIKDIAEILPQIIIYIATGYVFSKTFNFVALKQNTSDVEHILTSSLVIGYIYCNIAYLIPISISYEIDTICIVFSALILGYMFAMILRSKKIIDILDFLKIRDTGNLYYWDDIMDNDYPMKVRVLFENTEYEGMLHNFESFSNTPHIVLASYIVKSLDGKIINDFSEDATKAIILNTLNAVNVEVFYYEDSDVCKDLKKLCDANKEFEKQYKEIKRN